MFLPHDLVLNHADNLIRTVEASMHQHPAWALGDIAPHEQDCQSKNGAQTKAESPTNVHGEEMWVEQHHRQGSADRRTDPPAAIDREIHVATNSRRDELINSGVNGRILSTDSRARQEAAGGEPDEVGGEGCGYCSDKVDKTGNHEKLFPPVHVGQAGKEQSAEDGAKQVSGASGRDLHIREMQRLRLLEHSRDRTDDSDLKSIENPCDAQRDDHEPVPPAPGKTIHPGRNVRPHRLHVGPYITTYSFHSSEAPLQFSMLLRLCSRVCSCFRNKGVPYILPLPLFRCSNEIFFSSSSKYISSLAVMSSIYIISSTIYMNENKFYDEPKINFLLRSVMRAFSLYHLSTMGFPVRELPPSRTTLL